MPYTPNNVNVYNAAFTGCASGIMLYRKTKQTAPISFQKLMQTSDAVAQAIDTIWAGTPSQLDVDMIRGQVDAQFAGGFALETSPAFYASLAATIIGLVTAAQNQFAVEGITPPPLGGSGSGAGSFLGSKTFDFAGGNHITLTANDIKNAALHFIDSAPPPNPTYLVTYPTPASDAVAPVNLILNDTNLGFITVENGPGGPTADIDEFTGKILSFEAGGVLGGFFQNITAPLARYKSRVWGAGQFQDFAANDIQCGLIQMDGSASVSPHARFVKPFDQEGSYTLLLANIGTNDIVVEFADGSGAKTLPVGEVAACTFTDTVIRSVNGSLA